MIKRPLFGSRVDPACCYCQHSTPGDDPAFLTCRHKGKVQAGASCRRFRYDPLRRTPARQTVLPHYTKEEFEI